MAQYISKLWSPKLKIPWPTFTKKSVVIVIMGMTGAGKTSFIKMITGLDEMEVGHGLKSCTKQLQIATTYIDEFEVHLIDTPGFDDDELDESDILQDIATYLAKSGVELSGILYLHPINTSRMGGAGLRNLELLRNLVGPGNMKNVKLITTKWSEVTRDQGEQRRDELESSFWNDMMINGAQHEHYDNTRESGMRIVQSILRTAPVTILLQEELSSGCELAETSAGKTLMEAFIKLTGQYDQKLKELEDNAAQYEEALRKRDEANEQLRKLQEAKITELQQQIKDLESRRCVMM